MVPIDARIRALRFVIVLTAAAFPLLFVGTASAATDYVVNTDRNYFVRAIDWHDRPRQRFAQEAGRCRPGQQPQILARLAGKPLMISSIKRNQKEALQLTEVDTDLQSYAETPADHAHIAMPDELSAASDGLCAAALRAHVRAFAEFLREPKCLCRTCTLPYCHRCL